MICERCARRRRRSRGVDVRAGCNSGARGRGPCYVDLVFNRLVLGHRAKNRKTLVDEGKVERRWQWQIDERAVGSGPADPLRRAGATEEFQRRKRLEY